jgi:hypothetical protein
MLKKIALLFLSMTLMNTVLAIDDTIVKKKLSNSEIAIIKNDSTVTLLNAKGQVIQESSFSCGTFTQTKQQLKRLQSNLKLNLVTFRKKDIAYPLIWNHDKQHTTFNSADELAPQFSQVFPARLQKLILSQNPYRLFANGQGVMVANGAIWFCNQGIFAVNKLAN